MKKFISHITKIISLALLLSQVSSAYASIIIGGTRVIYPAGEKEVTVKVTNKGQNPVLIQSWMDNGDTNTKPENIKVPFILTPPINRVDPQKGQTLRMSFTGAPLPADKESVFWLNVLEIPAKNASVADKNILQVAFRSRIKVFWRPAGLASDASEAAKSLVWRAEGGKVTAVNNSPYFVSLVSASVNGHKVDAPMIAPKSSQSIALNVTAGQKIQYIFVNDYGAYINHDAVAK
ncbi:Pilus assembly protein PapD [Paramixta manurensis]|uniref:Pilus assembly protein PapD n=1 Tax=Paramixta manurensis TaxID=2740817 RepID=A0A6M8U3R0_9GAMM|nr:Pilus assembly protein PapD [Erwiniaceae bacterium PD-1]